MNNEQGNPRMKNWFWRFCAPAAIVVFFCLAASPARAANPAAADVSDSERLRILEENTRRQMEETQKTLDEFKKTQELRKKTQSWVDQIFALMKKQKYAEARSIVDQWAKEDPSDSQPPLLRKTLMRLESEPDEQKRQQILMDYINDTLSGMNDSMDKINSDLDKINGKTADFQAKNANEELGLAVAAGDKPLVRKLLAQGADPNAKDRWGMIPIETAARNGDAEVLQWFIDKKADVNAKGMMGITPLISAVSSGSEEKVRILLKAGADPNAKADTGMTALKRARASGQESIASLLQNAGALE